MANRTVKEAKNVHGTNPQYLVEKIIRSRIYDCQYWKEQCFALTAELLVDKAMELRYIGGVYGGNIKPTPFICLTLKMLQIQPEKDIVIEFIKNEEFKYVRVLGAFYLRLTGTAVDCYKYLEPLYNDNRKLRRQNRMGKFELVHMDEFIDELLHDERVCDIILPRIQKRHVLEENNELPPKVSALDIDEGLDEEMPSDEEVKKEEPKPKKEDDKKLKLKEREREDRDRDKKKRKTDRRSRSRSRSPDHRRKDDRKEIKSSRRSRTPEKRSRAHRSRSRDRRDNKPARGRSRSRDRHQRRHSRSRSKERRRYY